MENNLKEYIKQDNDILKNTNGNIVRSVIEQVDNQIHNSQNMEEVENSTKDSSFGLSIWKPMKAKSTQQTIELQNI
jgi:hypothetical protein